MYEWLQYPTRAGLPELTSHNPSLSYKSTDVIRGLSIVNVLVRMKTSVSNDQVKQIDGIQKSLDEQMDQVEKDYS